MKLLCGSNAKRWLFVLVSVGYPNKNLMGGGKSGGGGQSQY